MMPFNDKDEPPKQGHPEDYSEDSFWKKVGKFALAAGRKTIRYALILFYCLQDRDTPQWAKATIVGALGYFIFPADGIPDAIPVIGFSDDLVVITAALGIVVMHIKPEHWQQAEEKLKTWFDQSSSGQAE